MAESTAVDVASLEPWQRLYVSAWRGLQRPDLRQRLGKEILALLSPENLAVFCVAMFVYVAGSMASKPWSLIIDAVLTIGALYAIGNQLKDLAPKLYDWATTAWKAQTIEQLELAAGYFADSMVMLGPDAIMLAFGSAAFRAIRKVVLPRIQAKIPRVRAAPAPAEPLASEAPPAAPRIPRASAEPLPGTHEPLPKTAEVAGEGSSGRPTPKKGNAPKPPPAGPSGSLAGDMVRGMGTRGAQELASQINPLAIVGSLGLVAVGVGGFLWLRSRSKAQVVQVQVTRAAPGV